MNKFTKLHNIKNLSLIGKALNGRFCSSKCIEVSNKEDNSIFVMNMSNGPVNSLNLEFMEEIVNVLHDIENNPKCKAVVFASSVRAFSAGFYINEMLNPDRERLRKFWRAAQNLALAIMKTPLVTASAINGSCIAGGCVFSFLSDITVMNSSRKLKIGLSATKMGIVPPNMLLLPLVNLVGQRKAEWFASQSILLDPIQAKECGMVQYIVEKERVLPTAIELVKDYLTIPDGGRIATKKLFTKSILEKLDTEVYLENEVTGFTQSLLKPEIQNLIANHLNGISNR